MSASKKIKLTPEQVEAFLADLEKNLGKSAETDAQIEAAVQKTLEEEMGEAPDPIASANQAPPDTQEQPIETPAAASVKQFTRDQLAVFNTLDGPGRDRMNLLLV